MNDCSTRQRIVEAADRLFYEQGFEHSSFSDIAAAVAISRGNFYHHYKTKDEILDAVIARRLDKTGAMLAGWEADGATPAQRIRSFIGMLRTNRAPISRHGCPVGSLCAELGKLGHPAREDARRLFTLFRDWLRTQFAALGRADADDLAMHLLAMSQGIASLASAFGDEDLIEREAARLQDWLDTVLST